MCDLYIHKTNLPTELCLQPLCWLCSRNSCLVQSSNYPEVPCYAFHSGGDTFSHHQKLPSFCFNEESTEISVLDILPLVESTPEIMRLWLWCCFTVSLTYRVVVCSNMQHSTCTVLSMGCKILRKYSKEERSMVPTVHSLPPLSSLIR